MSDLGYGVPPHNDNDPYKSLSGDGIYSYPGVATIGPRRPGFYYLGIDGGETNSSYNPNLDELSAQPFFVGPEQTFDRIAVSCLINAGSSSCVLGIYTNENSFPGRILFESAPIDCSSSSGLKEAVINMQLSGMVWLAFVQHNAAAAFSGTKFMIPGTAVGTPDPYNVGPPGSAYIISGVSGGMPPAWPLANYVSNSGRNSPYIYLRKS